jgi:hypothetical protein
LARRRALIIGVDGYANEAWRLDGAVRDALAFAGWVIKTGGVAPEDVRLLLSPAPGAAPPVLPAGVPAAGPATSQGIIDALAFLRRLKPEEGGDRVYVYYAGHGAALPQWNTEPILIPVDFSDPETHSHLLLGFSRIIPYLTPAPFGEQLFFFDACRDLGLPGYEPPLQSPVGPYRPVQGAVRQYVLYGVAPGQRAVQIGTGIWTAALLDALEGRSYQAVSRRGPQYEVSLSHLAQWIGSEVSRRIGKAFLRDAAKFVQTPEYVPDPRGGDPVLATFTRETVPRARIEVFVEPGVAHRTCRIAVKQYVDGLGEEIEVAAGPPPPIAPPLQFNLRPADYSFQAQADRYTLASQPWTVDADPLIELTLEPEPPPVPAAAVDEAPETPWRGAFSIDDLELGGPSRGLGDPVRSPGTREGPRPPAASLTVQSQDPSLRIKLLDARRREMPEPLVPGSPLQLDPGIYRVQAWLPGDRPAEKTVEVRPGRRTEVSVGVPAPRLGELQMQALRDRGIHADGAPGKPTYLYPSELLGPTAGMRLGSLLAYAAYAATYTGPYFTKLRSFGVPPFPERGNRASGVLALVGVAGDWEPGEIGEFLRGCSAYLQRPDGEISGIGSFDVLSGMPAAAAWQTVLRKPGPLHAELCLPGFGATRYALAALPGRLTVLVAVLESDGSVDVQQFLFPLSPGERDFLEDPANVRKVDIAMRAFAAGEESPLAESDLKGLLSGRWIDPLLSCVAGYSLVRDGEPKRFAKALKRLTASFPGLPDAWVLAGLCDPKAEEDWFEKAVRCGVPLFAEGVRALGPHSELAELRARLLPGSVWSAWAAPRPPLVRSDS